MAGGVKDVGSGVGTGGMNVLNYDEKTRPFNRNDMIDFLWNFEENLNDMEKNLLYKSIAITSFGIPFGGFVGNYFGKHFIKRRAGQLAQVPFTWFPTFVRFAFVGVGCSVPYIAAQQWTVSQILDLDDNESLLAFHTKRLMIVQRSSLMFSRQSAREVTKEEQEQLMRNSKAGQVGRGGVDLGAAQGKGGGAGRPGLDVNLALGAQQLTPIAQTGYQDMKK